MCDVLLPPGVNPTAVKYIYISYHIYIYKIFREGEKKEQKESKKG
jgi:hypothetical protein